MSLAVLFVDDVPAVLDGLRLRLRRRRGKWDMRFASSGAEALEILAREPIDVLVSDMRMPGMDGVELLRFVKDHHPGVIRLVLSGNADAEVSLKVVPLAHQFLAKPCASDVLEDVIARVHDLKVLIGDSRARDVAGGVEHLPTPPDVYLKLVDVLQREDVGTPEVAAIVEHDMAICAKVLQLVNSAFFRLSRPITEIEEAVRYLGFATIKHVALAVGVYQTRHAAPRLGLSLRRAQEHGFAAAGVAASMLSEERDRDAAFVAGLLHDVGKVVLATADTNYDSAVRTRTRADGCHTTEAETGLYGASHAQVGAYLLGLWGLPIPVIEAVAYHHRPGHLAARGFGVVAATHVADGLVHELDDRAEMPGAEGIDMDYVEALGATGQLDGWRASLRAHTGQSSR